MEYRIGRLILDEVAFTSKVELLDVLTSDQYENLLNAKATIEQLHSIRRLEEFVVLNDQEFIRELRQIADRLTGKSGLWCGVTREDIASSYVSVNRCFLNYLSAIKTFLDHAETFMNRRFGKQSDNFVSFKKVLSHFYDNSFAYRFFYKLRNFAQHVGLPIEGIKFEAIPNREKNRIETSLKIEFDRDFLLRSFSEWGMVKKDLEVKEPRFFVTPLLAEMTSNLCQIANKIEFILQNELLPATLVIHKLIAPHIAGAREVFLATDFITNEDGSLKYFRQNQIPFETVIEIMGRLS